MKLSAASILGAALPALAQMVNYSPSRGQGITYTVSLPSSSAQSGRGDLYFQIKAPISYQWVGLGQGTGMSGANIFIMYAASATNVTLSPRLGKGEFEPRTDPAARITLLSGTGIENGMMIANAKCAGCASWDGGSMDFKSTSTNWIWAMKQGSAINSQAADADLSMHDSRGNFNFDLTRAAGGQEPNPFVASTSTSPSGSASASAPAATGTSSSGGGSSEQGGGGPTASASKLDMVLTAHGSVMGIAFLLVLPLGTLLLHLLPASVAHKAWIHGINQLFGLALAIAGLGMGIWFANQTEQLKKAHPIIGLVVVSLLFVQAIGGVLAHASYKKTGARSVAGLGHTWMGRALILLGIINGGLGLQLAMAENREVIAYGVCAGVVGAGFLAFIGWVEVRRGKGAVGTPATTKERGTAMSTA
ncbi:MAG: hypothetical protein M1814_003581 [Vezdaea aestivalis]|nr:MAG: hypothetical protein M1814_003581 [Vezdaea aestivalis]